jgi:hypothetical protein
MNIPGKPKIKITAPKIPVRIQMPVIFNDSAGKDRNNQ